MSFYDEMMKELSTGKRKPRFPKGLRPRSDGLVAVGGDLSPEMLVEAYSKGYFPWSGSPPIPWYCPQPRLLLFPNHIRVSRSLKKLIRKGKFKVTFDTCFRDVMKQCATIPRAHEDGTWITENMIEAYSVLHEHHIAHSIEVHLEGELCGGLYGLSLGHAFFGESMFAKEANASKVALVYLCEFLRQQAFDFVDCQVVTDHLVSMGAMPVPRKVYLTLLKRTLTASSHHYSWAESAQSLAPTFS